MTSPPLIVFPDDEALVTAWLNAYTGKGALLEGAQVGTRLPCDLLVRRSGGVPTSMPRWADRPRIDIEARADSKPQAKDLAKAAQAVMHHMPYGQHDGAVVTAVETDVGISWLPDDVTSPPTPRYVASYTVTVHPA